MSCKKKKKKEKIHIIIYLKYENKTYAIVSEVETYFDLLKTDRTLKHKKKKDASFDNSNWRLANRKFSNIRDT